MLNGFTITNGYGGAINFLGDWDSAGGGIVCLSSEPEIRNCIIRGSYAEYGGAIAQCAIITTLFLGGWKGPILPPFLWFMIKLFAVFGLIVWIRATWPRVRIDQLMGFAWKYMLPLSLINLLVVAIEVIWLEGDAIRWWVVPLNLVITGGLLTAWAGMLKFKGGAQVES